MIPPVWPDGPERPIHRPVDPEDHQDHSSGKQTCHTINNLLVIDETCQMCCLSATDAGKAHEQLLAELEGDTFPPGSGLDQDMGFQGYTCEEIPSVPPKKKPPGGELTPPENAANRAISSIRIRIEHAMGGVQRDRLVKDNIRLMKDGIRDPIMETCGGLHHVRRQYRPWNYTNSDILK